MPDNLPGSDFDAANVCSWCRTDYPPYEAKGENALANKFRGLGAHSGKADCLVGLSGGKDSTYALYRLVKHYHLKAEAFIYTHGGSKDFSLRNARTSCEKLGVPLHEVSLPADKHKKAEPFHHSTFSPFHIIPTTISIILHTARLCCYCV